MSQKSSLVEIISFTHLLKMILKRKSELLPDTFAHTLKINLEK